MAYRTAYPSRSAGRSNATRARRRSLVDTACGMLVLTSVIGGMTWLVTYANARDAEHFRSQPVASFPSRPEECNGECPPMDDHGSLPVTYGM